MGRRTGRVMWIGLLMGALGLTPVMAAEHGGQEHAGHEPMVQQQQQPAAQAPSASAPTTTPPAPAQTAKMEPTAEQLRDAIGKYVQDTTQDEGAFFVDDEVTGDTRELTLDHVHERVGKTGEYYYACADMKDTKSGELIDIDFDVDSYGGELDVIDVRIHKVNGKERYTYDANDNRIPVTN